MFNTSDDDFASPVVFKKTKPRGTALNIKTKALKSNKTKKKPVKKQITLDQMLAENNSNISDTNEEHLQMALALSKSTAEMLQKNDEENDPSWNLNLAMKNPDFKGTLLEFGFKSNRGKMAVENKLRRVAQTKKKTSKFRFITPILLLRTEEDRQAIIQSKISLILSQNTRTIEQNQDVSSPELSSAQLNKIKCSDCSIFRLNHYLDRCSPDKFKVSELDISDKWSRCGCLLKDWRKIASRDLSPEPQHTEVPKETNIRDDSSSKIETSPQKDVECHDKTVIQTKTSSRINCVVSPDLFDDTFSGDKSANVSEINSITPKIRKRLSCFFACDKSDLGKESLGINNSLDNQRKSSENSLKCSIGNNSCDNPIYHFDGYDTDDDFPHLNNSSDEEKDSNTINTVPGEYSKPTLGGDDGSSNENHRAYRISSSEGENEMDIDTDLLTRENVTTSDIDSHMSNIDRNLRMNKTQINCYTPVKSPSKCDNSQNERKKSVDVYIVLDSDEELDSTSNLLDKEKKQNEFICNDYNEHNLSNSYDKLVQEEFRKQASSQITEDLLLDCTSNDYSFSKKFVEDHEIAEKNSTEEKESNNSLTGNDSIQSNKKRNSIPLIQSESSIENDASIIDNEPNVNDIVSFENARLSPIFHCNNSNRISYRDSISLNVTKHIEEILAGSYNQINSLTLSDADCSSISKNRDSVIETNKSSCNMTKELSGILTDKTESLERSSADSSEEVICISDDELNYSCGNKNILKNIDVPEKVESNVGTLFKKYSSFTESPSRKETSFIRHKSESFITPKRNMVIKTKNITPMVEYDALSTPDIVKELDKFGLKPLKRKRGVNLLKYIYEATHPTVEKQEVSDETQQASKKLRNNESISTSKTTKSGKIKEVLNLSWIESIPESEIIFEKTRSSKIHFCQIPLQLVWYNFLIENPQFYEKILLYEPVQVEEIHKILKREGFKFHLQDLITFFDRKCITIKVAQNHSNKVKS